MNSVGRSSIAIPSSRENMLLSFTRRWRTTWLDHLADKLGAYFGGGLVLCKGYVCELRWMANETRVRVARYIRPPFPRRRVWVTRSNVLGL